MGGGAEKVFDAAAEEIEVVADEVCGVRVGVAEVGKQVAGAEGCEDQSAGRALEGCDHG